MCAALYAAGLGCSSSSPKLPPLEASGTPGSTCEVGASCQREGVYCIATGQACKYLECSSGSWQCAPDGGFHFDSGASPTDAAPPVADAADAADGADAADASHD
jgi:hypothetical protein